MAWTGTNPVTEGQCTKKAHFDLLWDNADFIYDFLGARTLFLFEDTAPDGWTIVAGCTDALLATKGGANAYNVAGGTKLAGTWTPLGHTHTGYSHAHTTSAVALTEAQMPAHTHDVTTFLANTAGAVAGTNASLDKGIVSTISNAGSGDTHTHGDTGAGGTGASASGDTAATWRPYANVGILVSHSGSEAGWTTANPVVIGDPTKKAHYDSAWDNLDLIYDFIQARKIWIFENTAPTGWSIIAGTTDGLLAVKGGTAAYNVAGGTALQGTWTQPDHVHARGAHTHTGGGHALSVAELPVHSHNLSPYGAKYAAGTYFNLSGEVTLAYITSTQNAGSASPSSHAHNAASGGTADSGGSATANTWRPDANVGILVEVT